MILDSLRKSQVVNHSSQCSSSFRKSTQGSVFLIFFKYTWSST